MNRSFDTLALPAFVFSASFLLLLRPIGDPDIWFHLAIGREVWARGAVPPTEFYVLPLLGEPGRFHEWGFGALYHLVQQGFGAAGMSIANAIVGAAIALFLFLAARARTPGHPWVAVAATAVALGLMEFRLVYRPETLLYLALAVEIWLLEGYLLDPKLRRLAPLPALACLLTQAHPSTVFLIALLGCYGLQALLQHEGRVRTLLRLSATALLMAAAAAVNPYGIEQLLLPLRFAAEAEMLREFTEFLPALETGYRYHFLIGLTVGVAAIAAAGPRRVVDLLLVGAFAYLAYQYARNIALLALALPVPVGFALARCFERIGGRWQERLAGAAAALLAAWVTLADSGWGVGVPAAAVPERSAQAIQRLLPPGPVFNFLHLGNYLAWRLGPSYPVSIDGRNFGRNRALGLHDQVFRADPGWQALLERFGFNVIVTPATLEYSGQIIPLVAALENDSAWALVAVEATALAFVRAERVPPAERLLPIEIWRKAEAELKDNLRYYPDSQQTRASLQTVRQRLAQASTMTR